MIIDIYKNDSQFSSISLSNKMNRLIRIEFPQNRSSFLIDIMNKIDNYDDKIFNIHALKKYLYYLQFLL